MKHLVICPTRGRPEKFERMVKSFKTTTHQAKLITCINDGEEFVEKYLEIILKYDLPIITFKDKTLTQIINDTFKMFSHFKYYSITNDDFIYHTNGWDDKLRESVGDFGIAYGNDGLQKQNMPTTFVISANIPIALGWLQLPTLEGLYGDCVIKAIGKRLDCLTYCEDVLIEHDHPIKNKSQKDQTFEITNSKARYQKDGEAFTKWLKDDFDADIERIKQCL